MTKLLRDAITQVERLPEGEQDAAAAAMLDYLAHRQSLHVSDEDLAEIRRRRADPNRKLLSHEEARARAGLSQAQLAKRMKTTQSAIARLESGRAQPSTRTLQRFAAATGHRLKISFEPVEKGRKRAGK